MNAAEGYKDFTTHLKLLISKQPELITTTLGNIFTLRLVGNKTHGDLAEIAIAEFINQYMYQYFGQFCMRGSRRGSSILRLSCPQQPKTRRIPMRLLQSVLRTWHQTNKPQRKLVAHLLELLLMCPGHTTLRNLSRYSS